MSDEAKSAENDLQLVASSEVSAGWPTKIKIMATSISLFVRLTASFVAAACDGWLRKQRFIVQKLKKLLIAPSVFVLSSKFSFSSVTESASPRNKLDSIVQAITKPITNCKPNGLWFQKKSAEENAARDLEPEQSVHVEILHDPFPNAIRADVIFIHGLHGSLFNTWKQGLWGHRKSVQNIPLKHKYKLVKCAGHETKLKENKKDKAFGNASRHRSDARGQYDSDYDHLLENITDLINNIDDKIKESQSGNVSNESENYSSCWPRDWLPKDCPGVRVIAVNYTTDPFLWRPVWITKRNRSSMTQRSQQMEDHLLEIGVGNHPIVWVGHSKGGLFVKQMLVDARQNEDPSLFAFLKQTKGIMFYSVPHRGSSLAHWNLPLLRQSIELTEVKKDCQEVLELHQKFMKLYEEKSLTAEVFSFVETILTFMWVTNVRVVSVDSAGKLYQLCLDPLSSCSDILHLPSVFLPDLGFGSFQGVNIDHREICKPLNRECFLYKELTNLIDRVL